jgi:hypothetical protein
VSTVRRKRGNVFDQPQRLEDHFGLLRTSGCLTKRKQWRQQRNRLAAWKPERLT